ncbi:uncharacterized protein LOC102808708 [Saccoglossus kowalevskii]|uniref:Intracellular protein transport protein USO1-like n=1 Tax=Saccoglossus kowalevskii TaxID=10224 RepID=A0ABM0M4Q8_SACKO|nr:PREDICTED: intracellular protein transport protein USO1-like [Saccoglossus kowalevskii]
MENVNDEVVWYENNEAQNLEWMNKCERMETLYQEQIAEKHLAQNRRSKNGYENPELKSECTKLSGYEDDIRINIVEDETNASVDSKLRACDDLKVAVPLLLRRDISIFETIESERMMQMKQCEYAETKYHELNILMHSGNKTVEDNVFEDEKNMSPDEEPKILVTCRETSQNDEESPEIMCSLDEIHLKGRPDLSHVSELSEDVVIGCEGDTTPTMHSESENNFGDAGNQRTPSIYRSLQNATPEVLFYEKQEAVSMDLLKRCEAAENRFVQCKYILDEKEEKDENEHKMRRGLNTMECQNIFGFPYENPKKENTDENIYVAVATSDDGIGQPDSQIHHCVTNGEDESKSVESLVDAITMATHVVDVLAPIDKGTDDAPKDDGEISIEKNPEIVDNSDLIKKSNAVIVYSAKPIKEDSGIQTDMVEMRSEGTSISELTKSYSDQQTQSDGIYVECCTCHQFSTPAHVKLGMQLKQEQSQRIAMEQLLSIVESESMNLRGQLLTERAAIAKIQTEIIDYKAEINHSRRQSSEYKMRAEELEQSLLGARQMILKLEEQVENTNYFKSGVDYMLEAKLANARSAESQKKLEVLQTELLNSQGEVNQLLDKLANVNREKAEMVSSKIHNELLQIADQRAREAEMKSQMLQHELTQLQQKLQALPQKSVTFSDTFKFVDPMSKPETPVTIRTKPKESTFEYKFYDTGSMLKSLQITKNRDKVRDAGDVLPELTSLDVDCVGKTSNEEQFIEDPLMKTDASDNDSDWSSSDDEKITVAKKPSSFTIKPPAFIAKPVSTSAKNSTKTPPVLPKLKKPPLAPKPKPTVGPKPFMTLAGAGYHLKSEFEKGVSFEQEAKNPTLSSHRRPRGPRGRSIPSKYQKKCTS